MLLRGRLFLRGGQGFRSLTQNCAFKIHRKQFLSTSRQCSAELQGKIVIYSKQECPLCDGLKVKIGGIIDRAPFTNSMLKTFELEIRDIGTNPEWERRFAMQVPVLALALDGEQEAIVPRTSPRVTADKLERHLIDFITERLRFEV